MKSGEWKEVCIAYGGQAVYEYSWRDEHNKIAGT